MAWWLLLIMVMAVWFAWGAGCLLNHEAKKLQGKLPPDAGCSLVPFIPLYPLGFFAIAKLLDMLAAQWGTVVIFWLHIALGAIFAAGIGRELYRIWSAKREPSEF